MLGKSLDEANWNNQKGGGRASTALCVALRACVTNTCAGGRTRQSWPLNQKLR